MGKREIRFARIFWSLLHRICSYWLLMILPIFFLSRAASHLPTTLTLPISVTSSKSITSMASRSPGSLAAGRSPTVLAITVSWAVTRSSRTVCWSFVDRAWLRTVVIDFSELLEVGAMIGSGNIWVGREMGWGVGGC